MINFTSEVSKKMLLLLLVTFWLFLIKKSGNFVHCFGFIKQPCRKFFKFSRLLVFIICNKLRLFLQTVYKLVYY